MTVSMASDEASSVISVRESLTYTDAREFQEALKKAISNAKPVHINLSETTFMDSSGIGMLLVAYRECGDKNVSLVLDKPQGDVKALLEMTQCYERFTIRD